jgi:hypothetical protein
MEREVWFEKVFWSYRPCHWKGWAFIAALVGAMIGAIFLGQWVLEIAGIQNADEWPFLLWLPIFMFGWIMSERHI